MFLSPLQNALLFTIHSIFSVYISIVLFRFLLQLIRADFSNPLAKFVVKVTNPLLIPLRKIIPGFAGIDWAALVLALGLQAIELTLALLVKGFSITPTIASISGLLIWSTGELVDAVLVIFLFATFMQIISSWLQPRTYNPITALCAQITMPLFAPVQRIIPQAGGLDFSPIVVIFFIMLMRMLVSGYIVALGRNII